MNKSKKKITVDREKIAEVMSEAKIMSYEALIIELRRAGVACSYPTLMRWNSDGWPPWELSVFCEILGCEKTDLKP